MLNVEDNVFEVGYGWVDHLVKVQEHEERDCALSPQHVPETSFKRHCELLRLKTNYEIEWSLPWYWKPSWTPSLWTGQMVLLGMQRYLLSLNVSTQVSARNLRLHFPQWEAILLQLCGVGNKVIYDKWGRQRSSNREMSMYTPNTDTAPNILQRNMPTLLLTPYLQCTPLLS